MLPPFPTVISPRCLLCLPHFVRASHRGFSWLAVPCFSKAFFFLLGLFHHRSLPSAVRLRGDLPALIFLGSVCMSVLIPPLRFCMTNSVLSPLIAKQFFHGPSPSPLADTRLNVPSLVQPRPGKKSFPGAPARSNRSEKVILFATVCFGTVSDINLDLNLMLSMIFCFHPTPSLASVPLPQRC